MKNNFAVVWGVILTVSVVVLWVSVVNQNLRIVELEATPHTLVQYHTTYLPDGSRYEAKAVSSVGWLPFKIEERSSGFEE